MHSLLLRIADEDYQPFPNRVLNFLEGLLLGQLDSSPVLNPVLSLAVEVHTIPDRLCAAADGKILFLGLRNPLFNNEKNGTKMAMVIPLKNPAQIVEKNQAAIFGKPLLWNLQNRGVRSMGYSAFHQAYFIVAGPAGEQKDFAIYRWSGKPETPPIRLMNINRKDFTPEALTPVGDGSQLLLLSDDGTLPIKVEDPGQCDPGKLLEEGRCPNKYLTDPAKKTFQGLLIQLKQFH